LRTFRLNLRLAETRGPKGPGGPSRGRAPGSGGRESPGLGGRSRRSPASAGLRRLEFSRHTRSAESPLRTLVPILVALAFAIAVTLGARAAFGYRLPAVAPLGIYLAVYAIAIVVRARRRRQPSAPSSVAPAWPLSGPIGRLGGGALIAVFTVTSLFALLNPFQLVQLMRQSIGNTLAKRRAVDGPPSTESDRSDTRYRLPFDGEWVVARGGTTRATSHSWDIVAQRYAYDFYVADPALRRHTGTGTRVTDYYCYDRPVLAAADGVVVAVESRIGRAPLIGYGVADFLARSFIGNHVIIRHAESEYGLYAHLVRGSVTVAVGEEVERGQTIGRCGHTGYSTEPHLHFQVQDRADFYASAGLPVRFTELVVNGTPQPAAYIRTGQRVSSSA
jgi:murein DD-endopeptidase MepM/ murein hydrolase activator NlpD